MAVPPCRSEEVLPFAIGAEREDVRFPPEPGITSDQLCDGPWRAHVGLELPEATVAHAAIGAAIGTALEGREPLVVAIGDFNWVCFDFSVEDDGERARALVEEVGRFAVSLVAGSCIVVSDVVRHPDFVPDRRRGLRMVRGAKR